MKNVAMILLGLELSCALARSQTNCDAIASKLFALPSIEPRCANAEPETAVRPEQSPLFQVEKSGITNSPTLIDDSSTLSESAASRHWALDSFNSDFDRRMYRFLSEGGYLERPMVTENRFDRCVRAIFEPEVFRIGKTSVSCSILTAIKRKNPLCLINPIVFNLSW